MEKQNSWFVLAEIFAILSGGWMVGAGMYLNYFLSSLGLMQNQLNLIAQLSLSNQTQMAQSIIPVMDGISRSANVSKWLSFGYLIAVIIFVGLSIKFWLWGYREEVNLEKKIIKNKK